MEKKDFGNQYDHNSTVGFLKRWHRCLALVAVAAIVASTIVAFVIPPRYKSAAVMIPCNSNRLSKAILAERYSMDFMDYGSERDCEYALEILGSATMMRAVIDHFKLTEHYGIAADDPYAYTKTLDRYEGNIATKRTNYMGVEVTVLDNDAQYAADIANYMVAYYDTLCHAMHRTRAEDAKNIMESLCDDLAQGIRQLEDSLNGHPEYKESLSRLIADNCKNLSDLQKRCAQTRVDNDQQIKYSFTVSQAVAADKKYLPKRALIIVLGTLGALVVCILTLLLVDRRKDDNVEQQ